MFVSKITVRNHYSEHIEKGMYWFPDRQLMTMEQGDQRKFQRTVQGTTNSRKAFPEFSQLLDPY